jgi:hypothetical protein
MENDDVNKLHFLFGKFGGRAMLKFDVDFDGIFRVSWACCW